MPPSGSASRPSERRTNVSQALAGHTAGMAHAPNFKLALTWRIEPSAGSWRRWRTRLVLSLCYGPGAKRDHIGTLQPSCY